AVAVSPRVAAEARRRSDRPVEWIPNGVSVAYFGRWVDSFVVWLYSTVESIPYLLLLLVLSYSAAEFTKNLVIWVEGLSSAPEFFTSWVSSIANSGLLPIFVAFGATFWTGPCRVVRGEVMKLRESDHVVAARALGAGNFRILFRHVIPNVLHLSLVYFSLSFIGAIKAEVILSFLGFGVKNRPSWGLMIDQAKTDLAIDFYWQIGAATVLMFGLVLAFNVFTDSLQDALDPKTV
ncbi:MAG: ABC transporter permease, partial [Acidobacteriota bacterium]